MSLWFVLSLKKVTRAPHLWQDKQVISVFAENANIKSENQCSHHTKTGKLQLIIFFLGFRYALTIVECFLLQL